jgi:predicted PurR-regulated permease PerM
MVDRLRTDQEVVVGSHGPATVADQSAGSSQGDSRAMRSKRPSGGPALLSWVPKLGVWAWSFVGFVAATVIVVLALSAVSEIVLPLTFAAVLAVIFKPLVGTLRRHRFKPTLAAGVVVLGLIALMTGVLVATVQGVIQQTDQINASVEMGRSLDVHPLVVLVVTAFGGLIGGIVGLILAVPFFVIARSGIARLQSGGFFGQVADRAEPTLQRLRD